MSRFATAGLPVKERPQLENMDGDAIFLGMDMVTPREYLPQGYYPLFINGRTSDGRAVSRNGTIKPVFANSFTATSFLGSGIYSNPNGIELLLIATPTSVIGISDTNYPFSIPIPANVTISGECTFDQNFDKIYLNNLGVTLVWDGVSAAGFVINTQQNPNNTTLTVTPNVQWSQNVASRRVFPLGNSLIGVTGILDYTEYDNILSVYRLNTGTSDSIVGVFPYSTSNLIVAKRYSFDLMTNFSGDLSTVTISTLSSEIGTCSRKAVKMVGADMIFPFDTGVFRIQQVIQDRIAASALPVAAFQDQYGNVVDPIQPLLKRINWQFASGMVAAVVSPYYYLAVPLDGSTVNNAILVYNTIKDKWEGYDQWKDVNGNDLVEIDDLWVTKFQGVAKLYCVDNKAMAVYVLYEGKSDILATGEYQVSSLFETRGYTTLSSANQYKRVEIGVSTWWPSMTVSEITDKYNDVRVLNSKPITKDSTAYGIFGLKPYDITNVNSDFDAIKRQDYSIGDGTYFDNGGSGINIDQTQQSLSRFATMARGRWISYRVQNSQGQCAIDGVILKSAEAVREQTASAA